MLRQLAFLVAASAFAFPLRPTHAQTTWFVDVDGSPPGSGTLAAPFTSLQAAIVQPATQSGDTIVVAPGAYAERIDLLGKSLAIRSSAGAAATVIDGGSGGSVVTLASGEGPGTRIEGFTLRNGAGTDVGGVRYGGGLYVVGATVELEGCVVELNQAGLGAGGWFEGAALTASDCTFADNALIAFGACDAALVPAGGGLWIGAGSTFELSAVDVLRNTGPAAWGAGVALRDADGSWSGGVVSQNRSTSFGCPGQAGGLLLDGGTALFEGVLFEANVALGTAAKGGAVYAPSGFLSVANCSFRTNRSGEDLGPIQDIAGWGGAIRTEPGASLVVRESLFSNNLGYLGGGAIDAFDADVQDTDFYGNVSQFGGAVHGSGHYQRCEFRENLASSPTGSQDIGGGAMEAGGTLWLVQCLFKDNQAFGPGGGTSGGTLIQCQLRNNLACEGGGASGATLSHCIVRANEAFGNGGGLSGCNATSTVIAANVAGMAGGGAAGSILDRCTLWMNDAVAGSDGCSGLSLPGGGTGGGVSGSTVTNSILWQNAPDQVAVPLGGEPFGPSALEYCDVQDGFAGVGNFAADPLFWQPFASDFRLQPGSPCIDAGDPAESDPNGSPLDVGALPFNPNWCPQAVVFCTAKTNSQGCVPAIGLGAGSVLGGPTPFTLTASQVVNQKVGVFFYGLNGRAELPYLGGTLCAKAPLVRTPLQHSGGNPGPDDCSGQMTFDLGSWVANGTDPAIGLGTAIVGQFWYRDPAASQGIGLTDAVEVVACQ